MSLLRSKQAIQAEKDLELKITAFFNTLNQLINNISHIVFHPFSKQSNLTERPKAPLDELENIYSHLTETICIVMSL